MKYPCRSGVEKDMATKIPKKPENSKGSLHLDLQYQLQFWKSGLVLPTKAVLTLTWHLLYQSSPTESQQKDTFDSHVASYLAYKSLPSKNLGRISLHKEDFRHLFHSTCTPHYHHCEWIINITIIRLYPIPWEPFQGPDLWWLLCCFHIAGTFTLSNINIPKGQWFVIMSTLY